MARVCPHCGGEHPEHQVRCSATGRRIGDGKGLIGTTLEDRYHLVRLLGDGGMGAVYKAADRVLRRFVAIKLLHPDMAQNAKSVERFQREARSAATIGHPNIIDILDFGYAGRAPYLVMEYLRGRSLAHAINSEEPMAIPRACRIATHTLAGLAAAHARGILHRDLKPANLMLIAHLGDRDFVKICDFGFAALLAPQERIDEEHKSLTPARTLVGTPAYAAPERLRGDDRPDPRIDVYSVGVLLFEMLAGKRPFDAPTFAKLARKVRKEPPPSLRELRRDCPHALERAIMTALTKDSAKRWKDAESFAAALVPFGGRNVPDDSEMWTDSFTMDLIKIRARETQRRRFDLVYGIPEAEPVLEDADRTERQQVPIPHVEEALAAAGLPDAGRAMEPRPEPVSRRGDSAVHPSAASAGQPVSTAEPEPIEGIEEDIEVPDTFESENGSVARPSPEATGDQAMALDGALVVPLLRFVAREFGERSLKALLDALPPEMRPVFESGIAPGTWVPYDAVAHFVAEIDAQLGNDDLHFILHCGRATAEGAFKIMRDVRPPSGPDPERLLVELPQILAQVTRGFEHHLAHVGRGYGRFELRELGPPSLTGCVSMVGFLEHSLSRFGAGDVEVNLLTCRALGDDQCLFDISWLTGP